MVTDSEDNIISEGIVSFIEHTLAASVTSNPLHGAELIQQLLKVIQKQEEQILGGYQARYDAVYSALNELADYLYGDDMILHFDDRTYANMKNAMGTMKKLERWVNSNYIESENKQEQGAE